MRLIHIGCHKCGSTFIQDEVLPRLRRARAAWCSDGPYGGRFRKLAKEFFALVHCDDLYFEGALRENVYGAIRRGLGGGEADVLSWEGLSGHHTFVLGQGYQIRHTAHRLHDIFPEAGILILIRNQRDFLRSYYKDDLVFGFSAPFEAWLEWRKRYHMLNYPRYSHLIATYQEVFGRDQVCVLPFERLFQPNVLRGAFEAFGVPTDGFEDVNWSRRHNPSFGRWGLAGFRLLGRLGGSKLTHLDEEPPLYRRWRWRWGRRVDRAVSLISSNAPALDFVGYEEFLREWYGEDNRRTEAMTGLDLSALGYPLVG